MILERLKTPLCLGAILLASGCASTRDPLPSWEDGPNKAAVEAFVERVTTKGNDFVPVEERIAVFDNDGTLWAEQPAYFQLFFAMDRVRAMAGDHPEWRSEQPFQAVLEGDLRAVAASGEEGLFKLIMASHAGMSSEEFESAVAQWVAEARHPESGRRYTSMVYQPMLELLDYLRENDFRTYIVSGGGIDFMRVFAEEVYGVPPEQTVGSSVALEYRIGDDGVPRLERLPKIGFINDKGGKPVGIARYIGRRPIAAFGNSDGDLQMLQWTAAGDGPSLMAIVHHTDADREWAYDRESHIGRLDAALDETKERGWVLIDMRHDWRFVFPEEGQ